LTSAKRKRLILLNSRFQDYLMLRDVSDSQRSTEKFSYHYAERASKGLFIQNATAAWWRSRRNDRNKAN